MDRIRLNIHPKIATSTETNGKRRHQQQQTKEVATVEEVRDAKKAATEVAKRAAKQVIAIVVAVKFGLGSMQTSRQKQQGLLQPVHRIFPSGTRSDIANNHPKAGLSDTKYRAENGVFLGVRRGHGTKWRAQIRYQVRTVLSLSCECSAKTCIAKYTVRY